MSKATTVPVNDINFSMSPGKTEFLSFAIELIIKLQRLHETMMSNTNINQNDCAHANFALMHLQKVMGKTTQVTKLVTASSDHFWINFVKRSPLTSRLKNSFKEQWNYDFQ